MRNLAVLAALLLGSAMVQAPAQEKDFIAIHGFDKMSCADWFGSDDNADVRQQYIAWIRGVVTGYNFANPDNQVIAGRMPSDFALGVFVDNYCHSPRATTLSAAAFALIRERRGGAAVGVIDDQLQPLDKPKADNAADPPGFRDWLARQSADIRSLGVDIQRNIFKKETALDQ